MWTNVNIPRPRDINGVHEKFLKGFFNTVDKLSTAPHFLIYACRRLNSIGQVVMKIGDTRWG